LDSEEKDFILEKIMIEYGNELVRLAFSYVKDTEIAKDVVQNTFLTSCSEVLRGIDSCTIYYPHLCSSSTLDFVIYSSTTNTQSTGNLSF